MGPFADGLLWLVCCAGLVSPGGTSSPSSALRTFVVEKPPVRADGDPAELVRLARGNAVAPASSGGRLQTTVGIGYVQRAGWGAESIVSGTVGPLHLQAESLFTFGPQGPLFDHGTILLKHINQPWLAEAGDLFSELRGPATGLRVSWQVSDHWRPAFAVYGPARHIDHRSTALAIRNRLELGRVTLDGEVSTDAAYSVRARVTAGGRLAVEASQRRTRLPENVTDHGVQAEMRVWRGLAFSAGTFQSDRLGDRSAWHTVGIRVPLVRSVGLTLERTISTTGITRTASSALMVDAHTSQLMLLQRYEWGDSRAREAGMMAVTRDRLQSMASYTVGPRLNLGLRVATEWRAAGPSENWLEATAAVRVARRTSVQVTAPVPQPLDTDRVRVLVEQGLPNQCSLLAEYGRPAAYQDIQLGADPPRFRLMVRRTFNVATPATGGSVRGAVFDHIGHPVAGVRVRLGPYSTDTDAEGRYAFAHLPNGEFDLSLDAAFLPADYAWDGRSRRMKVTASSRFVSDLLVAPLNAIHGQVYADRNGNGRFDPDEGVLGAVVRLGSLVTATGANGAYDFYNLPMGAHTVTLDTGRLPAGFAPGARNSTTVELRDDQPVTGVDFIVTATAKPVNWRRIQ